MIQTFLVPEETQIKGPENSLILFVSHKRALYRSVVFNTLAIQTGMNLQILYRREWVPDEIWDTVEKGGGNPFRGIKTYVCAAIHQDCTVFIPLREVEVISSEIVAETLIVRLKTTANWIDYCRKEAQGPENCTGDSAYDVVIKNYLQNHPQQKPGEKPVIPKWDTKEDEFSGLFILQTSEIKFEILPDDKAWLKIVEKVSSTGPFKHSIFFRLIKIRDISQNNWIGWIKNLFRSNDAEILRELNDYTYGYELWGGKNYVISFLVYAANEVDDDDVEKINFKCDGPVELRLTNNEMPLGFRINQRDVYINPVGTFVKKVFQIRTSLMDSREKTSKTIQSPQLDIPVNVVMGQYTTAFFVLIILGLLIVSDVIQSILGMYSVTAGNFFITYKIFFSLLGAAFSAIGIFMWGQYKGE